jgi:glucose/arabinose dehydrogenase
MKSAVLALLLLAQAQPEPGLLAEYFEIPPSGGDFPAIPVGRKPAFARVETAIDHAHVTGEFHGTKLSRDFLVRWTGLLRCAREGLYSFYLESDDGSRLFVDGALVVDNAAGRDMEQKPDSVLLAAGDRAFRFEYVQRDGPAGVNLQWRPPGGGRQVVPPSAFFHDKASASVDWDRAAWERRPAPPPMKPVVREKPGRYAGIDFGPFTTRTLGPQAKPTALAGLLLRVAPDATVCFDTRELRVAAAWTGEFLRHPTEKDGIAGLVSIAGTTRFDAPGVQGRWLGLTLHGDRAVLSYETAGARILEVHGFEQGSFTRTLRATAAVAIPLANGDVDAGASGGTLRRRAGVLEIELPASTPVKVSIPKADVSPPEDPEALLRGGPPRWAEPVVTKGALGREAGAYQVDTLSVPYENPWKSYMRFVALDFFPDGRAAVATFDGDVWIVSGIDAKLEKLAWKRFATGLCQPMGLRVIGGKILALGRDQITRLHDLNGDGEADLYENFSNAYSLGPGYGEYPMDLQADREGNLYFAKAAGRSSIHSGCVLKLPPDGSRVEVYANGFRTPMGLCVGPDGTITATDQQGNYMGASPIVVVRRGGFYGHEVSDQPDTKGRTREPALAWLPLDLDNSPGGQAWVPDDRWGPLQGRLVHTSYGQSRLLLVLTDEGRVQGGVVPFPLPFASGIMRAAFNPVDGQLYVAGLRGWQTTGVRDGCLQRVRFTGRPARMPVSFRVRKSGLDLTFTDPLDPETAADADSWSALGFNVVSTADYGSPEFHLSDPKKRGREPLPVSKAALSPDGKTVTLDLPGFRPMTNLILKFTIRAADGQRVSHTLSLTINRVPQD